MAGSKSFDLYGLAASVNIKLCNYSVWFYSFNFYEIPTHFIYDFCFKDLVNNF